MEFPSVPDNFLTVHDIFLQNAKAVVFVSFPWPPDQMRTVKCEVRLGLISFFVHFLFACPKRKRTKRKTTAAPFRRPT